MTPGFQLHTSKLFSMFSTCSLRRAYWARFCETSRRHGSIKMRPSRAVGLVALLVCTAVPGYGQGTPMTPSQLVNAVRESIVRVQIMDIGQKSGDELKGVPPVCQN